VFAFGPFELHPVRRLLLDGGRAVRLGSRAFDLLVALVLRAGEVVGKEELIATVWPDVFVEEANLRVHIAALRKVLGDDQSAPRFVANVPGRGYCFVAPLSAGQSRPRSVAASHGATGNLPLPPARMIGRAADLDTLLAQLAKRRLVTVAGPGGIGKTTIALAAAVAQAASFRNRAAFVDLAPIGDPALVPGVLAAAFGVVLRAGDPAPVLAAHLRDKELLVVIDGCDRVIDAAAALAEALLRSAPNLRILATSREPLRAESEWVQRLPPLGLPPADATLTAAEAVRFPAVELFVDCAAASLGGFKLQDAQAPAVAEICRRLDGIALAIELAAGSLHAFGPRELAALLDDPFEVLTRGRRTALPQHQTLRAALDWSYDALPWPDQLVLRRLSIFEGSFTLDAAREVASDTGLAAAEIEDRLADLVAKSLAVMEFGDGRTHYRLLETTRAYAREKLAASGEHGTLAYRHAEYHRTLFACAAPE
jgi:predicted ATPase/DNA-binding winged helix-turn-helix (wHTH) protein